VACIVETCPRTFARVPDMEQHARHVHSHVKAAASKTKRPLQQRTRRKDSHATPPPNPTGRTFNAPRLEQLCARAAHRARVPPPEDIAPIVAMATKTMECEEDGCPRPASLLLVPCATSDGLCGQCVDEGRTCLRSPSPPRRLCSRSCNSIAEVDRYKKGVLVEWFESECNGCGLPFIEVTRRRAFRVRAGEVVGVATRQELM
jgi:hypothetical protein